MRNSGLQLLVEVQSASQAMLEVRGRTYVTLAGPPFIRELCFTRVPAERDRYLRRAVDARVPATRVPDRVDRERDAAGQGQQELRGDRRPGDVLLRHKTIR